MVRIGRIGHLKFFKTFDISLIACGGPNLTCQAWVNQEYCGYDYPKCGHCVTNPLWIGDGLCDEHLNNPECGNDGGDCADLMSLPGFTKTPSDHLEGITKTTEESTCVFPPDTLPTWLGNGICDPALNNALCDWDGNDCHNHPSFSPSFGTQYSLLKV